MKIRGNSCHPWQEEHEKQKRRQSTGGGKLWREKGRYQNVKEEGTTRGEDEAKGKPQPGGQMGGRWGGNQADLKVKAESLSPACAYLGVTDFDPSEPAALRLGVMVL